MATERNAWGMSIFCEDIRYETGGKFSLMGIYLVDMIFPSDFPIVLPKLVISIKYNEIKNSFSDDLKLNIFLPGDAPKKPSITHEIKRSEIINSPSLYPADEDSETIHNINLNMPISPLVIKEEGEIKVRMQCGNTTTRLGRLMLRKVRPNEIVQF